MLQVIITLHKNNYYRFIKIAIQTGTLKEAYSSKEIGCNHLSCVRAAIVVPLYVKNEVVGTLKLYFTNKHDVNFQINS